MCPTLGSTPQPRGGPESCSPWLMGGCVHGSQGLGSHGSARTALGGTRTRFLFLGSPCLEPPLCIPELHCMNCPLKAEFGLLLLLGAPWGHKEELYDLSSYHHIASKTCRRKEPLLMGLQSHSHLFMQSTTFGKLLFTLFSPKLSSLWSEVTLVAYSFLLQLSQAQL